jgi:TRAP-type C4-dicarboxylate transport system permease small subunit
VRLAAIIDTEALLDVVIAAFAAGIGITAMFGVAIYGTTRFADFRREGHTGLAWVFGVVAALCLVGFAGAVVLGIVVMTQKD